jgi:N-acetylglucosamine-6-sulfatase
VSVILKAAATAMAAACAACAVPAAAEARRPNVVVIETDDQTAASLRTMPIVNRLLVDQGVTFDNAFVSFALCCPSRATFLTGQYAHNHGVFANTLPRGGYYKLPGENTLPVWLSGAGYRTIHLGKYLNDYGLEDPAEVPPGWTGWHGLVDPTTYRYFGFTFNDNGRLRSFVPAPGYYQTDVMTQKAVRLIDRVAGRRRPFFMWTAYLAPHFSADKPPEPDDPEIPTPVPAPPDRDRFAAELLPPDPSFDESDVSDKPTPVRDRPPFTESQRAGIQENYQQELETLQAVDRSVGQLIAALRAHRELRRTVIVFTSDNGYFHGEHRIEYGKTLPYEPAIRVPLVIRGPGLPRGLHLPQLVSNQDLTPTILDATGTVPRRVQDGRSLMPLMRDGSRFPGRDLLIEGISQHGGRMRFAGIRGRRWTYTEYSNGERELYDLSVDPAQTTNRAFEPRYAAVEANLADRLAALRNCRGASCRRPPARPRTLRGAVRADRVR